MLIFVIYQPGTELFQIYVRQNQFTLTKSVMCHMHIWYCSIACYIRLLTTWAAACVEGNFSMDFNVRVGMWAFCVPLIGAIQKFMIRSITWGNEIALSVSFVWMKQIWHTLNSWFKARNHLIIIMIYFHHHTVLEGMGIKAVNAWQGPHSRTASGQWHATALHTITNAMALHKKKNTITNVCRKSIRVKSNNNKSNKKETKSAVIKIVRRAMFKVWILGKCGFKNKVVEKVRAANVFYINICSD